MHRAGAREGMDGCGERRQADFSDCDGAPARRATSCQVRRSPSDQRGVPVSPTLIRFLFILFYAVMTYGWTQLLCRFLQHTLS